MHKNLPVSYIKKRKAFYRTLAIFFLFCMAILLAGLAWFWGFLERYEASTPEAALRSFSLMVHSSDYETLYERGDYVLTEFNNKEAYMNLLRKKFPSDMGEVNYIKKSSKDAKNLYGVYKNGEELGAIELYEDKKSPGTLKARAVLSGNCEAEIIAPRDIEVYANGILLDSKYVIENSLSGHSFYNAPAELCPPKLKYQIKDIFDAPIFTAKSKNNEQCEISQTESGEYFVIVRPSEANISQYEQLIQTVSKTYAAFISRDATFTSLNKYLVKGTVFQIATKGFYNGWYLPHEAFSYENVKLSNLEQLSEDAFCGEIYFDYIITRNNNRHEFPSSYKLLFTKENDKWKLYDLLTL